jgi:ADP-glucose pyrophosphorylase
MKAITHASVVNFQPSAREMYSHDLDRRINEWIDQKESIFLGTINLEKEEIRLFGRVQKVKIDEEADQFAITFTPMEETNFQTIEHSFEEFFMSHEALFDLVDEQDRKTQNHVMYVTFDDPETKGEITYFFVDEHAPVEPLAIAAEFWQQVSEVGRDIDFNLTGCMAHEMNNMLKQGKLQFKCDDCDCD